MLVIALWTFNALGTPRMPPSAGTEPSKDVIVRPDAPLSDATEASIRIQKSRCRPELSGRLVLTPNASQQTFVDLASDWMNFRSVYDCSNWAWTIAQHRDVLRPV
ncbi:MAG: hypothetical protein KDC95_02840 [Planctomycetes bacterium]|nr:hypothetical protein [Planctomycetota bacterium]